MRAADNDPSEVSSVGLAGGGADGTAPGDDGRLGASGLLAAFMALMPDAAVVVDATGTIVAANEQAAALFGYAPEELPGLSVERLVPDRYRDSHRARREDYARAPLSRAMGAGLELSGRRKDGGELPVEISLAPITTGDRSLFIAAVHDVSARRDATAAQAQLAAIVLSSLDAIISMTPQGQITSWNPGATHLLGYHESEMVGTHVSRLLVDTASVEYEEVLATVMAGGWAVARDTLWRHRDGHLVDVAFSVSALREPSGRLLAFSVIARDITERRRNETELRRVLAEARLLERQHAAAADIRLALLSGAPLEESFATICERARELADASGALLVRGGAADFAVQGAAGDDALARKVLGVVPGLLTEAGATSGPVRRRVNLGSTGIAHRSAPSPVPAFAGIAVTSDGGAAGLTLVLVRPGRDFSVDELAGAVGFAEQAAMAERLAAARDDRDRLLLVGDRDRIARDLHDLVIQRLFASGMLLQNTQQFVADARVGDRVAQVVEELDATIREIRTTVFELEHRSPARSGLRDEIIELTRRASGGLGFEPSLQFAGPVDTALPTDVEPHVLAVVREGLSNAARHAHASRVEVFLAIGEALALTITDDGVGFAEGRPYSGLANLKTRAEQLDGACTITSAPGAGTRLEWRVPLR